MTTLNKPVWIFLNTLRPTTILNGFTLRWAGLALYSLKYKILNCLTFCPVFLDLPTQAYFNLTKEYGIVPSMSRRGNCYDNAMAENFSSILKTECIYRHKPATFVQKTKFG